MFELLQDPETIPFFEDGCIRLIPLKREIDRRVEKIIKMLGGDVDRANSPDLKTTACQIGRFQENKQLVSLKIVEPERALSPHKLDNNSRQAKPKIQKRTSTPLGALPKQQEIRQKNVTKKNVQKRKLQGVLSASKLIAMTDEDFQPQIKSEMHSPEPPTITSMQFSFNQACRVPEVTTSPNFRLTFETQESVESDSECSQNAGRSSFSTVGRRMTSVRKVKATDRTALPQLEKRPPFSQQCQSKMDNLISCLISQKRREPADSKLRANIIRKIAEKYQNYFDNI